MSDRICSALSYLVGCFECCSYCVLLTPHCGMFFPNDQRPTALCNSNAKPEWRLNCEQDFRLKFHSTNSTAGGIIALRVLRIESAPVSLSCLGNMGE